MSSTANLTHCSTDPTNYACFNGIHSVGAAIVFAVLYVPLFGWNLRQSIARPTYVFIILTFFCAVRIAAFIMRALLAGSDSAGENLGFLIASQVIYSVGFFGLIYSAYTLVLDRILITDAQVRNGPISRLTQNRMFFRLMLLAAVALGIAGSNLAVPGNTPSNIATGNTLRKASTIIFLVASILLLLQTIFLAHAESRATMFGGKSIGQMHGKYVLGAISLLLLMREAFLTATSGVVTNEGVWYPLVVATEFIAVCLFATPGLVPERDQLPK